jgi:hypothetical protein
MITEAAALLTAMKSAGSLLNLILKMSKDGAVRDRAIELQSIILNLQGLTSDLQFRIISLQDENMSLKDAIRGYEAQIKQHEEWKETEGRYKLKEVGRGSFAYVYQQPTEADATPTHYLCATCFENEKKSILQRTGPVGSGVSFVCPVCKNSVIVKNI